MQTPDDGFHEIQLNGKQLVFLFMAATVVSVLIFLFGVLVGRGVRAERGVAELPEMSDSPLADATPASNVAAVPAEADPRVAPPPVAPDELSYFNRLEKPQPATEELKPATASAAARPAPPPMAARPEPRTPTPARPASSVAAPPAASRPAEVPHAARSGYSVQLAALNSKGEADAMAKRLSARGYEAYVLTPAGGAPAIYRVRIGNYDTRREAESVAARLEKEGQFKPWVTR